MVLRTKWLALTGVLLCSGVVRAQTNEFTPIEADVSAPDGAGTVAAYPDIQVRPPLRICRIFADGVRGPWINYEPTEGTPACVGRGFDTMEPVLGSNNPCGGPVGIPANCAAEGGLNPFCAVGADVCGCPANSPRYTFGIGTFSTGSVAHPLNPPAYSVGQNICAMELLFTERVSAGSPDPGVPANTVGNTFIDIVWHSAFNVTTCGSATQPLLGPIVDGVGLDFGPAVAGPTGSFYFSGPVDVSGIMPPFVMPPTGGAYEILFWNDAAGTIVAGNNQPGLWGIKQAAVQGTAGPLYLTNTNFSAVTNDTGGQYIPPATECATAPTATACLGPLYASVRLGVPSPTFGPANDACAFGTQISGSGMAMGTTVSGTNDGSSTCDSGSNPDVWYRYVAACSGTLNLDTCSPGADTVLAVYTGDCGALTEVACNDNCGGAPCGGPGSCLSVAVTAGTTYRIRVATVGGTGTFTLTYATAGPAPANDNCASATVISNGTFNFSTCGATTDGALIGFCGAAPVQADNDIWYRYTATCNTYLSVRTCGSSFDTVLAVYSAGCPASDFSLLACNDDAGGSCNTTGLGSALSFPVSQGTEYLIRVGGFGGASGSGTLLVFCGDECAVNTSGATPENEGDCLSVNPGCPTATSTPAATPIACGQTIVGTTRASGGMRDIDAYSFTLTTTTMVTFTVTAEFPALAQIQGLPGGAGSCTGLTVALATVTSTGCGVPFSVSGMLNPGSYLAVVTAQFFFGIECAQNEEYTATLNCGAAVPVTIAGANPPRAADNPYQPGTPFLDPLQNRNNTNTVSQGIGATGTPGEGPVQYSAITVTFSGAPSPAPSTGNVAVACTGGTCPTASSVTPVNATTFTIGLSGVIPALQCTTLTFAGTVAGEKLQYRSQPGNSNLDGFTNTQDLLFLVTGVSSGAANMAGNLARYDIDRSGAVNTQDFLREVQLLNGVNTTQVFNGTVSAACP